MSNVHTKIVLIKKKNYSNFRGGSPRGAVANVVSEFELYSRY